MNIRNQYTDTNKHQQSKHTHIPNPRFWGFTYDTLVWIKFPKQYLHKLLLVPEKQQTIEQPTNTRHKQR